jgi:adenine-specific DNA-methyltransferase
MVEALSDTCTASWLDPCVGSGAFLHALHRLGVEPQRVLAIDVDPSPSPSDSLAMTVRGTDFLHWARTTDRRFERIVANPPYIALSKLEAPLRLAAMSTQPANGSAISLASNYWCAFVWASLLLLKQGGSLCFVLPAAWDYADYAEELRISLPKQFVRFEVYRSLRPLFDTVRDGSVVIVGRNYTTGPNSVMIRSEHESPESLIEALGHSTSTEAPSDRVVVRPLHPQAPTEACSCLGDIMDIRLGGVTGDARYFLMTEAKRQELGLPKSSLRPVLSRAQHLVSGEISRLHWEALRDQGDRVWLFDPPARLLSHPQVREYLKLPSSLGGCNRAAFKVRSRTPWYQTKLPAAIDGFISGMSRFGPWICLRGMPRLNATNTLYTIRFRRSYTRDQKAAWALSFLTTYTRNRLESFARVYPDGLLKYEPGDLVAIPLLRPKKTAGAAEVYLQAITELLKGDPLHSRRIADQWFEEAGSSGPVSQRQALGEGRTDESRIANLQAPHPNPRLGRKNLGRVGSIS